MSANAIDEYLSAEKVLGGVAQWRQGNGHEDYRIQWPVRFLGEDRGVLTITFFPNGPTTRFKIVLSVPPAIWRVDFDADDRHPNPFSEIEGVPQGLVLGSHMHAWGDNRHLMRGNALPPKLPFARSLPPNIKGLEDCLQWFCEQVNISFQGTTMPPLPSADRLL